MYINNLTPNSAPVSFNCNIERTPFAQAGIKRSKELIKEGSEYGLAQVNRFINNIELIKSDNSIKSLNIDAYPEDIFHFVFPGFHTVKIDGKRAGEYTIETMSSNNLGDYFMEAINIFVERHYGKDISKKTASKQIPEIDRMSELSIRLDSAKLSAQRKLSGMIKTLDVQI